MSKIILVFVLLSLVSISLVGCVFLILNDSKSSLDVDEFPSLNFGWDVIDGSNKKLDGVIINLTSLEDAQDSLEKIREVILLDPLELELDNYSSFNDFYKDYFNHFSYSKGYEYFGDYMQSPSEFFRHGYVGDCDDSAGFLFFVAKQYNEDVKFVGNSYHAWIQIKINGLWVNYDSINYDVDFYMPHHYEIR